ncbi:MAG: nucleoside phosphorylase [Flammeovirgaceae bacterium]|nr:nucleoside phosphorylase [Flammeovirgaceae bacterium]
MFYIPETELIINPDGSIYHLGICPGQISNIILTVGDPERVKQVAHFFDKKEPITCKREFVTQTGEYNGKRITVMSTGMGTDNMDIFLNELDALFNIDFQTRTIKSSKTVLYIIRIGTSGSIRPEIEPDALLATHYSVALDILPHYYQIENSYLEISLNLQNHLRLSYVPVVSCASDLLLKTVGEGLIWGTTATCPGFYAPQGRTLRLSSRFSNWIDKLQSFHSQGFRITNLEMETSAYYTLGKSLGHEVLSTNAILANRINKKFSKNPEKTIEKLILHVLEKVSQKDLGKITDAN